MYRRLLLTHDGSKVADAAIPHALALGLATGAEVLALHVTESPAQAIARLAAPTWREGVEDGTLAQAGAEAAAHERAEAEATLARIRAGFEAAGLKNVRTLVLEGDPGAVIVGTAAERDCDLLVMATHGRSGVKRALLGSVADYVVRHVGGAAVLLCRPEEAPEA